MTPKTAILLVGIIGLSLTVLLLVHSFLVPIEGPDSDQGDQNSPYFEQGIARGIPETQTSPPEAVKLTDIEIVEQHLEDDGSGIHEIRGSFRNNGTTTIHGFEIRFDLIAENGSVIGQGGMLGWDIGPNETRELNIIVMNEEMKGSNFTGVYAV